MLLASTLPAVLSAYMSSDLRKMGSPSRTMVYIPSADRGGIIAESLLRPMAVKHLKASGFRVHLLDVARAGREEVQETIRRAEAICVGGGMTFYLLDLLRRSGAADAIVEATAQGALYLGVSAGAVVASPDISYIARMDMPCKQEECRQRKGLGLTSISVVPHWGGVLQGRAAEDITARFRDTLDVRPITNKEVISVDGDAVYRLSV